VKKNIVGAGEGISLIFQALPSRFVPQIAPQTPRAETPTAKGLIAVDFSESILAR